MFTEHLDNCIFPFDQQILNCQKLITLAGFLQASTCTPDTACNGLEELGKEVRTGNSYEKLKGFSHLSIFGKVNAVS